MEENSKNFIFLKEFAEIADKLTLHPHLDKSTIHIDIPQEHYTRLQQEIEEFVNTRVQRGQQKVSLDINGVKFLFTAV